MTRELPAAAALVAALTAGLAVGFVAGRLPRKQAPHPGPPAETAELLERLEKMAEEEYSLAEAVVSGLSARDPAVRDEELLIEYVSRASHAAALKAFVRDRRALDIPRPRK